MCQALRILVQLLYMIEVDLILSQFISINFSTFKFANLDSMTLSDYPWS
jgi:hypothetical protein